MRPPDIQHTKVSCDFLFVVQDQLQQKIVCPGVVTCLTASPNGLFLAAAVAEAIYLWEVSELLLLLWFRKFYEHIKTTGGGGVHKTTIN